MKQITEFPRIPLGVLPTPIYKLENLSRQFGKNIYIKRDDMTGIALCRQIGHEGHSGAEKAGGAGRRKSDP